MGKEKEENPEEKTKAIGSSLVGEKGQIVIPKSIREMFGINPGDRIILLADKSRGIALVKEDAMIDLATGGKEK